MARGYQDYQRVANWDDSAIISESLVEITGRKTQGRFDVSRFAYIMGKLQFVSREVKVIFKWYLAETGGTAVGEKEWFMDPKTAVSADVHLTNLGPFLEVIYECQVLTEKYKATVQLFPSNRIVPGDVTQRQPYVYVPTAFKLAAKAAKLLLPQMWYAGPAQVAVDSSFTGYSLRFTAMFRGFEYERQAFVPVAAAFGVTNIMLPFTAQQLTIENSGAAEGEVFLSVLPTPTGSS